jgi:hypothetical protein
MLLDLNAPIALNIYPPMGRQRIRPVHEGGKTTLAWVDVS